MPALAQSGLLTVDVLPLREYVYAGATAAAVTFLLVGPVRVLALQFGAVAWPRGRDVHVTPTARWGGLAMLAGVLAGIGMAFQLPAMRLAFDYGSEMLGVAAAAVLLVAVGALDDRYELDAFTKLAGQVTAAGVLALSGVQWTVLYLPFGGGEFLLLSREQGVLVTVLLTVALVNAMNFVDGLDGLASGVGLIAAGATAMFTVGLVLRGGQSPDFFTPGLVAFVLAGACAGFLPHNFNPARIFMGDSGSMLIGLMLAAATTMASGRLNLLTTDSTDFIGLFAPVIVMAAVALVPLADLVMAVVRRTRAGRSPFAPDKMHLHHRLLEIGHSQRRAVLLIYLWAGVLAFGAVALALIDDPFVVLWAMGVGIVVAVLASSVPRARTP
ncbi:MAG: MraY family glycosyltransferase [Pseudonocardiales bacterium]|nr:MraY family glycosyltransferase [Pseudonocardiales bacterium]